jgi:hypothetical protein
MAPMRVAPRVFTKSTRPCTSRVRNSPGADRAPQPGKFCRVRGFHLVNAC